MPVKMPNNTLSSKYRLQHCILIRLEEGEVVEINVLFCWFFSQCFIEKINLAGYFMLDIFTYILLSIYQSTNVLSLSVHSVHKCEHVKYTSKNQYWRKKKCGTLKDKGGLDLHLSFTILGFAESFYWFFNFGNVVTNLI